MSSGLIKLFFKPVVIIDKSQAWFWSKKWQKEEKEAEEDINIANMIEHQAILEV